MTPRRCLAVLASVALSATPAHAAEQVDESPIGRDAPVLPAQPIKAPPAPPDFLVETHGFLKIVFHPSTFDAVRKIAAEADAARAAFASTVGQAVLEQVELRVARTPEELAMLSPREAQPTFGSTGVAYPSLGLALVSVRDRDSAPTAVEEVFRHQVAHVALFDATAGQPLPRWLQEGLAVQMSGEATFARAQLLWTSHLRKRLLPFTQLDTFPEDGKSARIAWAESADFVRFLARDSTRFASTIARAKSGDSIDHALIDAYGTDLRGLEQAWRDDLGTRCVTMPLATAGALGWGLAIGAVVVRRRRRRRLREATPTEPEIMLPEVEEEPPKVEKEPRLLVCDRGLGHVVYIVEGRAVPKVEHEGKRHTLH